MKTLVNVGLVVAGWFLVNNLVSGLAEAHGRLIDAAVFAVGISFVHSRHSRLAMALMAANWFVPCVLRLATMTPTATVWNVVYGALWACGVVGVWRMDRMTRVDMTVTRVNSAVGAGFRRFLVDACKRFGILEVEGVTEYASHGVA